MMKPDKDKLSKKPGGKVFDVRRPGKAPASPTSRPVIMGHKPEAQEAQTAVSGIGEARPLLTKRKIEIVPSDLIGSSDDVDVSRPATQQKDTVSTNTSEAAVTPPDLPSAPVEESKLATSPQLTIQTPAVLKQEASEPTSQADIQAKQPESEKEESEPRLTPEEQPAETSSVPEEPALTQGDEVKLEEEPAPEPVIEPLFDDSGVVVSTHDHHHRHHALKVVGLLLLILLLAAATLDVALDLGLLNLEDIPHTDFL
jgi:hypothetical protein